MGGHVMPAPSSHQSCDAVLIGSGIMSASLGALLKSIAPDMNIQVLEATDELSLESSNGWNNAGTGHAGLCELSYTPNRGADGSVDVSNAISIFADFEKSLQFWSHAVEARWMTRPQAFVNAVPHVGFVSGREQVEFLRARHQALARHHLFHDMEFTSSPETIAQWAPLLMEGRDNEPVAATRALRGTDVNFGAIARQLLSWLDRQPRCSVATGRRVVGLKKLRQGWSVSTAGNAQAITAKFVFIGAGGGSLTLLRRAGVPAACGLGGFPVGGQWLICDEPAIVALHPAKVYGQALGEAPTMAVPHLDRRILDGKPVLLFGPFASWTTKFLHRQGRWTDLPKSIGPDNLATLLKVGWHNRDLIRYLMRQGSQSMQQRLDELRRFYPAASLANWRLIDAGIRVQAIKKTDGEAGIVHYGTELITDDDKSIAALLGASPGASVAVSIALNILEACYPQVLANEAVRAQLHKMIPAWGTDFTHPASAEMAVTSQKRAARLLQLDWPRV